MLAVVDTNVWVSAFLSPDGTPAKLLIEFKRRRLALAVSEEIEAEYHEVLHRPQFNFSIALADEFLGRVREEGMRIHPLSEVGVPLPDPGDAPFIAAALWAACPVVTGNARHFPPETGVEVLSPAACLERLVKG